MAGFHTKTFLKHDDYMTPKYAWENIKSYIPEDKVVWEPFYGDGKSGDFLRELINTSNITIHTVSGSKDLYLDIFSCKQFDIDKVRSYSKFYFLPGEMHYDFLER